MKPYYQDKWVTIYHADCREILLELPQVDLVLTDPPYGHGDKWSGGTWAANPIYDLAFKWDAQIFDNNKLIQFCNLGRHAIVWGGNYYSLPPSRCWLAWIKTSLMPTLADFELAWTNMNSPSKLWNENRNADGKRNHPTQKPMSLMKWCILQAGDNMNNILDPFMGSGTTLKAAKELNRKCIGIEIEERYCEIAARRCSQEVMELGELND